MVQAESVSLSSVVGMDDNGSSQASDDVLVHVRGALRYVWPKSKEKIIITITVILADCFHQ